MRIGRTLAVRDNALAAWFLGGPIWAKSGSVDDHFWIPDTTLDRERAE